MHSKKNYLYLLLFYVITSFSQENKKDSVVIRLKHNIETAVSNAVKVNAYIELGNAYLTNDIFQAEEAYQKAINILKTNPNILKKQRANVYGQLGVLYKRKGEYPLAMEYYLKSKEFFEEIKDTTNIANLIHNIAMVYRDQREHKRAIKSFQKVIAIKHKLKESVGEGIAYNMMGVSYRKLKQLDSAIICYEKAKNIFNKANDLENLQRVNSNLAALYHYQKKYNQSIQLHQTNIKYYKEKKKLNSLFNSHFNIAKTFAVQKQYNQAIEHVNQALNIAEKLKLKDKLSRAYLRRSWIHSKRNKYKEALEDHRKHKKYSDSIYNRSNVKKIQELELTHKFKKQKLTDSLQYEAEKKNLELIKDKEQTKRKLYFSLFISAMLLGILVNIWIKSKYKKKNKIIVEDFKKKEEELKAFTNELLNKINKQEKQLKKRKEEKEETSKTKKLHIKVAEKILTKEDWYNFKEKFNQVYPMFFKSIKEKGIHLTSSEERLVTLEKLGLDNNQIAKVLGISVDSVFVNRYRLRKKINAPKSISILQFLEELKS
ncbi:Tetratricopeptide repeat protein [Tenacibaculum sp. 190524A02b]|uniref:tetratricopeptide repeat protein n=1 Tax=Tenacibaculum vairaonense TaxID=3137860 RepID=UPI0032B2BC46